VISTLCLLAMVQDGLVRTPAIYRCTTAEGETKFLAPMIEEEAFDAYCIEPKPGPSAAWAAKGKARFVSAKTIDTAANMKWRNATIAFVTGKISPKEWVRCSRGLNETVHFLSSPKTQKLREATGQETRRAVFAEMFLVSQPGRLCITADDIGGTRYLPGPGRYESWILAMHDYLGPMLYQRAKTPYLVTGKPRVLRADAKPGLLIFEQRQGMNSMTFYLNNGPDLLELPKVDPEHLSGIAIGLDLEGPKPRLQPGGFVIVQSR
jgi:hypothetical protein